MKTGKWRRTRSTCHRPTPRRRRRFASASWRKGKVRGLRVDDVRITYGVNQGLFKLTWNGTMPSNTTIPSGAAIAVDVISAVGGSDMNVLYDSNTRPSQLNLTVSSFIAIDSLAIYNAPYAGGSIVSESEPNDTVYIRTTVSNIPSARRISPMSTWGSSTLAVARCKRHSTTAMWWPVRPAQRRMSSNGTLARAQGEYLVTVRRQRRDGRGFGA